MKQTYTQNHIVRYIYKDASLTEQFEIEHAIHEDKSLWKEYKSLMKAIKLLPKVSFLPSKNAIQDLMVYSSITALEAKLQ